MPSTKCAGLMPVSVRARLGLGSACCPDGPGHALAIECDGAKFRSAYHLGRNFTEALVLVHLFNKYMSAQLCSQSWGPGSNQHKSNFHPGIYFLVMVVNHK